MSINLGNTYQDKITGFQGVATGHVHYLTGCNQVLLAPKAISEFGKEPAWFDEQRLELLDAPRITLDNSKTPGFDKQAPVR